MSDALATWSSQIPELRPADGWTLLEIPLDLRGAVTMVVHVSATSARPERLEGAYVESHEVAVRWLVQDSLGPETGWHFLAAGWNHGGDPQTAARISTPLGTSARLALFAHIETFSFRNERVLPTLTGPGDGLPVKGFEWGRTAPPYGGPESIDAQCPDGCAVDHRAAVDVSVAVRSI
jgi:hypothetical protein